MTALYTITEQFKELAALAETADEDLAIALSASRPSVISAAHGLPAPDNSISTRRCCCA